MSDAIRNAEIQFTTDPDAAADRAHVLEKIIGFERDYGRDVGGLERILDALYGGRSDAERAAKNRRRAYARARRTEEMQPFIDAIRDAYPEVVIRMDWSRKHGRKTIVRLAGVSFGPEYQSSERYGAGDPDDLLPEMPKIVRSLKEKLVAMEAVEQLIADGKIRQQGGFVVLPSAETHPSYDGRFSGIPLSMNYDSIVQTHAAATSFVATGEFTGRNAYGK